MSPGPSVAVVLKQTVGNGRGHGFAASWFHAAGIFLWAFTTVSGLAVVVESSEILFNAITLCGAAYLAWILWLAGYKLIDASVAAVLNETNGAFIILLAWLMLGEKISRRKLAGISLTLSGVLVMILN